MTAVYGQSPATAFSPTCDGNYRDITFTGLAGEYSLVSVIIGNAYTFKSSVITDYITISNSAGTTAYATGTGTATWTSTFSGTVRFYTHTNSSCGSMPFIRTRSVKCGLLYDPCDAITSIPACGLTQTANLNLVGGVWLFSSCSLLTLGQELIYSFTAPATGTYTLTVTAAAGGTVDFFWRDAATGCANSGWNCIGAFNSAGNSAVLALTAGASYYFLLDPEFILPSGISFNMTCPPLVFLPVQLLYFDVHAEEGRAELSWSTASEQQSDFFTVERSRHGEQFEAVQTVEASGNSAGQKNYSATDEVPLEGTSYYRLRQTDHDGSVSFSEVKMFEAGAGAGLRLYPNPGSAAEMRFAVPASGNGALFFSLLDLSGKELLRKEIKDNKVFNPLSGEDIAPGIYFICVTGGRNTLTAKAVITKK